jgi:DNA topoisomerase-1
MADAQGRRVTVTIQADDAMFQASGSTIDFAGYLRAYVEGSDDPDAELADKETILPAVKPGEPLKCNALEPKQHTTQPPSRFTEASLTKALEERGIGRPSTYASIIDTIQQRQYVFKRSNSLIPSWMAFSVSKLLSDHLPKLVDFEFTAQMEDDLDAISRGEAAHVDYLREFYFGNGAPGLKTQLANKVEEVDARDVSRFLIGRPEGGTAADEIYVRVGRYGPYLEQGDRRASIAEDMPPDELTLDVAIELLGKAEQGDEPLGRCPESGRPIYIKAGRFGPYVQLGDPTEDEKPKNASLLKGMDPATLSLDVALKLLSLPRTVGQHPESGDDIVAHNGRYGPYVKCGAETRSLPADVSPLDVTLEQSLFLLEQPKVRGRRAAAATPIRAFDESPVTKKPLQLLNGRYGPYVTDGVTNASLPKDTDPKQLTMEAALALLAERAAKGPAKKKGIRKGSPTKKAATPTKKATAKSKKRTPSRT